MNYIDFFKLQAKNFLKDYNDRVLSDDELPVYMHENPKFFKNIDDIIIDYNIDEFKPFTLMNAQHIIANLAGFNKWSDILHANQYKLELGKLLLEHGFDDFDCGGYVEPLWANWENLNLFHKEIRMLDDSSRLRYFKHIYFNEPID